MKLLITTQAVDENDQALGFFCRWLEEFAKQFERIEVICLREGEHCLPPNVRLHSLGKERGSHSRAAYALAFLKCVWRLRHDYDTVFVHMNQEYVLLAGWLWKLLSKRIYLWRNHYAGSYLTDIAAAFCAKVFYTSRHSYTAKYPMAVRMPVGVDTKCFYPDARIIRQPRSILFLARMAPSKRPQMLVDALAMLARQSVEYEATLVGSPEAKDQGFYEALKTQAHASSIPMVFIPNLAHREVPDLYRAHEIFVNCSPSGMLDKTIFEAAACGMHVLAASDDFAAIAGAAVHFSTAGELAEKLRAALAHPRGFQGFLSGQTLNDLSAMLVTQLV